MAFELSSQSRSLRSTVFLPLETFTTVRNPVVREPVLSVQITETSRSCSATNGSVMKIFLALSLTVASVFAKVRIEVIIFVSKAANIVNAKSRPSVTVNAKDVADVK